MYAGEPAFANLDDGAIQAFGLDVVLLWRNRRSGDLHSPAIDETACLACRLGESDFCHEPCEIDKTFVIRGQGNLIFSDIVRNLLIFELFIKHRLRIMGG
jgi:hypothetical protein